MIRYSLPITMAQGAAPSLQLAAQSMSIAQFNALTEQVRDRLETGDRNLGQLLVENRIEKSKDVLQQILLARYAFFGETPSPRLCVNAAFFGEPNYLRKETACVPLTDGLLSLLQATSSVEKTQSATLGLALLASIHPEALDILEKAATHPSPYTRKNAITALGELPNPKAVPALERALKDEDEDVRHSAILGWTGIFHPSVTEQIEALNDPDTKVRQNAVFTLSLLPGHLVYDALCKALEDNNWEVRQQAVHALGEIGNPAATDLLIEALKDMHLTAAAILALGRLGDLKAVPHLNQIRDAGVEPMALMAEAAIKKISSKNLS